MSITDELRKFANDRIFYGNGYMELTAIADRIDAEHQKALDEWKAKHGHMWLKGYAECHAELLDGNETLAADLENCGWVRLPVDADDVPVHVGDVMVYADGNTCPMEVVALVPPSVFLTEDGPRYADMCRHYHALTVEDVLREFAEKITDSQIPDVHPTYEEAIAEYAKRLTLAEGEK